MGKRGPAPKPTALRVLHGDRKDRINLNEPTPREGLPACPPDVDPAVREVWNYTMAELVPMGTVSAADRDALLAYCEAVVVHRKASEAIAEHGLICRGGNGAIGKNPALAVQKDAAMTIRQYAQEFGLTPSARSGIKVGETKSDGGAARLLSG